MSDYLDYGFVSPNAHIYPDNLGSKLPKASSRYIAGDVSSSPTHRRKPLALAEVSMLRNQFFSNSFLSNCLCFRETEQSCRLACDRH